MAVEYCEVTDVQRILQLGIAFGAGTTPTSTQVEAFINRAEDEIDNRTGHAWREVTVTNEFYDLVAYSQVNHRETGIPIYLRHRAIRTLTSSEGGTVSVDDCETADWNDSADMTTATNSTTFQEGTKSLSLTKDGTATATASTSKTTTNVNFTGKDFNMWLYVISTAVLQKLAASDCLVIRFGSDSSNYYEWTKDRADLEVGWNQITELDISNAETTGTPVILSSDYTYIGLTAIGSATTWSTDDILMDDLLLADVDKLEVWTGSSYSDWLDDKTEGRANDYWMDEEEGVLYLRYHFPYFTKKAVRMTYRYGESTVPNDIKEAAAMMAAIKVLESDDRSAVMAETGDPTRIVYDNRIRNWQREIDRIIRNRTELRAI